MSQQELPETLRKRYGAETVEELWNKVLTEGNVLMRRLRHIYALLPSNPRCVNCHRPFAGPGGALIRLVQDIERSDKNPRYCTGCYWFTSEFPGGAQIELTMLFVDVRGSTSIAETMADSEFGELMNRFYEAAIHVLVREDAFIDKLVGDEVTALFIPGFAGQKHAARAIKAARGLLHTTGHADPDGPWIPVGVGVHTGVAWVGSISGASGEAADFTALGDNVNIAARLASSAGKGEAIVSNATIRAAGENMSGLEARELYLKGKTEAVGVRVLTAS